ncbi:TPA: hypothetical protein KMB16_001110 [Escherichia coli]|nr:hypothetical protein [Escherichia coli]EFI5782651.1 hypothetical protein [Escherichia coli]EGK3661147.1 hypothetical protein [Escherichia coli]EGN7970337.1 hypothetical protein [Escherichia coli]EIQ1383555.1 hypothetical protein [Escherichia coli]EJB4122684.1 hypothetical protein [Escherichia coli]
MNETELKHVIALLLEDAKRLQQLEPNAGTEERIIMANKSLHSAYDTNTKQTDKNIIVYGHSVNREFAYFVLEKYQPTFCRIIEELTLKGKDKEFIENAVATASAAAVASIKSMITLAINQ